MAKKWADVIASTDYQQLSDTDKAQAQQQYFDSVVKPNLSADQVGQAQEQFYNQYPVGSTNAPIANGNQSANSATTPQEAPQEAQPLPNSNPQPTAPEPATEPQSALERGFNYVGNVAASGGRMIAGGVADVANVGVGALNLVGQGVQAASNAITGENGQYQPIAPAGYGELDQYLMPRGTGEEIAASIPSYVVGGEVVAPIKAAENAGRVARVATSLVNQLPASITGALAENNQGDAGAVAKSTALNAVAGATLEKVGGAAVDKVRNLLPESLGGFSQAEKAATVANPEYLQRVLQGGNEDAQAAFRTATTDEAGNSILTPSQVFNTDQGAKFVRAEQRDLSRGTNSQYQQRLDTQKQGDQLLQAAQQTISPTGDVGALQAAAQDTTQAFKDRASTLYNESKAGAQQILDSAPVKITNLKMPETKTIAQQHLDANAATGNINLNAETRRTLNQFNKAEVNSIEAADKWKRTLNEKAQKAYRNGDYTSYNALKDVNNSFKNEMDSTISAIDPQAGKLWKDADNFYSASVGDFGDKSVLGKIAGKENPDLAANALIRGQNANYNTDQIVSAMRDAVNRGDIATAQQLSQQLGQGLGEATRGEAIRAATTGENFSATKFANTLSRLEPQAQAANDLAAIGGAVNDQAALNTALQDVIRTQRTRAEVPQPSNLVAQLSGRTIGGGLGSLIGGLPGAAIGQEVGGRVTNAVSQGLLDRLAGTVKRGNEYINYLSNPENAQAVADVLAQRGATLENATAQEVKGIIDNIKRGAVGSMLEQSTQQPEPEANQTLPTLPSTPATQASSEPAAPVEEVPQVAQAAKKIGSDKAIDLYKSLASAETGGLDNRFIRTKAAEAGPSTAYGPAQITYSLAKDFAKNHPELFTEKERDYLDRFVGQGKKMLHAAKDDPVYGYGGVGELHSKADQRLYARVAVKMLDYMIADNNGSLDTTVKKWRGANDAKYFAKVASAYKEAKAERKTKRQGWGRPTAA
ncbi:hypothetical protein DRT11_23885 [Salmonella enterica subsp. enterica]|nr:hypothetical protein [Salmonella enterica subsp. enterica serovar Bareilly]